MLFIGYFHKMETEEKIMRYFNSFIGLKKAEIKNLKARKFRMLVESEPNCNLITYPYYFLKWRFAN